LNHFSFTVPKGGEDYQPPARRMPRCKTKASHQRSKGTTIYGTSEIKDKALREEADKMGGKDVMVPPK
jgi:hypothetical protein